MRSNSYNNTNQQHNEEQPKQKQKTKDELIEEFRKIGLDLFEENKQLQADKIRLENTLGELREEYSTVKRAVLEGNLQAAVWAVHRKQEIQNADIQAERDRINAELAAERAAKEAEQLEQDTARVLKEIPGLKPEYEKRVTATKKQAADNLQKFENFINLDYEGLKILTSSKHSIFESPTRFVFTNEEWVQNNRKRVSYRCDVCLHDFITLSLAEEHLHKGDDFDVHKKKAIEGIKQEESEELRQLASKYNEEVSKAIWQMRNRDSERAKQQRYKEQAKQVKEVTSKVLITDDIAEQSRAEDLRPWPPRQENTRA